MNVVYNTDAQNISDAQIKSQIAALNKDFRATNPDKSRTPAPWKGLVTDARIKFKLVKVDANQDDEERFHVRRRGQEDGDGRHPAVQSEDTFESLGLSALTGGLLGYAQFPGRSSGDRRRRDQLSAPSGRSARRRRPFNKGRTATHEVGHYLNLRHIWGDTPDCSGTDMVADTPNCAGPNFGKPTFPVVTCNNGPNGDMFMNYMDYTDDAAMFMFTAQQVLRMRTALETVAQRADLSRAKQPCQKNREGRSGFSRRRGCMSSRRTRRGRGLPAGG